MAEVDWKQHVPLGRTGLQTSRLGIASGYGVPAEAIERAFHEHGINYFYLSQLLQRRMPDAIRNLSNRHREQFIVVLAGQVGDGFFLRWFTERWLRRLKLDYLDVLLLGGVGKSLSPRLIDRAVALRDTGRTRFIGVSSHQRPLLGQIAAGSPDAPIDLLQLRYNAVHRGAESDIFPHLDTDRARRPATVCFTATCWRKLLTARKMPPGESPLTAAQCYRFVLHQPHIDVCLTAPRTAEQFDQNLTALEDGPLSEDELARIRRSGDHVYGKPR